MQITVKEITPDLASAWLARNTHNRNTSPAVIDGYARDMAAGSWKLNGEAIKFSTDGRLLDGQHRLHAVVKAGVTITSVVVEGLASGTQAVMDAGKKRTAADSLGLGGVANARNVAAAARLAIGLEEIKRGRVTKRMATVPEIHHWVTENPEVITAAGQMQRWTKHLDMTPAAVTVAWMLFNSISPEENESFWQSIAENATTGRGDPRSALIARLASARMTGARISPVDQLDLAIRAWNAWREGRGDVYLLKVARAGESVATPI